MIGKPRETIQEVEEEKGKLILIIYFLLILHNTETAVIEVEFETKDLVADPAPQAEVIQMKNAVLKIMIEEVRDAPKRLRIKMIDQISKIIKANMFLTRKDTIENC